MAANRIFGSRGPLHHCTVALLLSRSATHRPTMLTTLRRCNFERELRCLQRRVFSSSFSTTPSLVKTRTAAGLDDLDLDDDFHVEEEEEDSVEEPYKALLELPARAAWRMTPTSPPPALGHAQRLILDAATSSSSRRRKQTQATLLQMMEAQQALRDRRERERKRAVRNKTYTKHDERQDANTPLLVYGPEQAMAAVQHRLYPQFAMMKRVLLEAKSLLPTFRPTRVLDFGVGCGSASAASWDVFDSSVDWMHLIDASTTMREVAESLLKGMVEYQGETNDDEKTEASPAPRPAAPRITTSAHMSTDSDNVFDLCMASFTMSDLPDSTSILTSAALLYEKLRPGGLLIVLEPGTPDGFANIRMIRNMLLDCCPSDAEDACQIVAPCTHNGPCPLERKYTNRKESPRIPRKGEADEELDESKDGRRVGFCSFVQTMPGGSVRRRGEKLSYLVVQKCVEVKEEDSWDSFNLPDLLKRQFRVTSEAQPMHPHLEKEATDLRNRYLESDEDDLGFELLRGRRQAFGRIIQAPKKKKGHVLIDCCVNGGIERHRIPKSMNSVAPGIYGAARKSRWGGLWVPTAETKAKDS